MDFVKGEGESDGNCNELHGPFIVIQLVFDKFPDEQKWKSWYFFSKSINSVKFCIDIVVEMVLKYTNISLVIQLNFNHYLMNRNETADE